MRRPIRRPHRGASSWCATSARHSGTRGNSGCSRCSARAARRAARTTSTDFEQQGFIKKVEGNKVRFDYRGMNQPLVDTVTVSDVIWACEQLAQIPDGHWQAAFRAGCVSAGAYRSLHQEDQGKDRAGSCAEGDGYALDAGRCSFSNDDEIAVRQHRFRQLLQRRMIALCIG